MNVLQYLKDNYVSIIVGGNVVEEDWKRYADICKDCKSAREVDEMVMFQSYYKVNLPIIRSCDADKNNVQIVK